MNPTPPAASDARPASARLRADVALYATADGHVLRAGDDYHHVALAGAELDDLLTALVRDRPPATPVARAALDALVGAGLADPRPPRIAVAGTGVLATALRAALRRMGVEPGPGGAAVVALDDAALPVDLPAGTRACWRAGHRVLLSPPGVPAVEVAARHHAATVHRASDRRVAPRDATSGVRSAAPPLAGPGLELAAVQVAAELLRPAPAPDEAVVVDLVALSVSRHPVLPVPPAPR
ncbi:hypothetical protein [Nocardioides nitrophenolicus]|uniref:hypothetical protein n=1 Tax=Nocardioides nitrophenolicus TaxID=60489 RepID=UPI00195939F6|nr:hypothetical protein [Nocardioides nitrophenolicus]MBM7517267.1 hypothetical protein [Nocardioides nitrophenolicus]